MKVILAGAGAFGVKHLEAMAKIDGIEVVSLVSRDPVTTGRGREEMEDPALAPPIWRRPGAARRRGGNAGSPTQLHAQQAVQCLRAGKHVMIEIPIADSLADARARGRGAARRRSDRDGRAYPPLQSQPSVDPQAHPGRRAQGAADGRADLFFPPHQHERARASRAAGPIICSGITPAIRSICFSTRPASRSRSATRCRGRPVRRSASRWT